MSLRPTKRSVRFERFQVWRFESRGFLARRVLLPDQETPRCKRCLRPSRRRNARCFSESFLMTLCSPLQKARPLVVAGKIANNHDEQHKYVRKCGGVQRSVGKNSLENGDVGCCFTPPSCRYEIGAFLTYMTCLKLTKLD